MTTAAAAGATAGFFRFSTRDLPMSERAAAVHGLFERGLVPVRMDPLPGRALRVDIVKWGLPGLGVLSGVLGGVRQERAPAASASGGGGGDLFLGVNLAGSSPVRQGDREATLRDGDGLVLSRGRCGFAIGRPTSARFLGLVVPRAALAPLVTGLGGDAVRFVPRGTGALRLLASYLDAVTRDEAALATPELRRVVVTHVHDLAALVVGATRDAAAAAEGRGVRAAWLRAIKAGVAANLQDPGLSVAAVAARQRVTPRYVHKLFEGEGVTFAEFVLLQRLARARRMLADRRFAGRAISSVAYDVGFGDLSYFNRAFRHLYDATPSEVRQQQERAPVA
jgi:AraC-like DNA-binding protein